MRNSLLVLLAFFALTAKSAILQFDFSAMPAGTTPTNFEVALAGGGIPPQWKIVEAEVPPTLAPFTDKAPAVHRSVLAQVSEDMTDERFPMFVYDGQRFNDFKFTTRFKMVSGVAEQMAGVVFRFQNASNFYVVRVSALGKNLRFYKVVNGVRSDPIGPAIDISAGAWHTLAVKCEGNQISIWLDGQQPLPALGDYTFTEGKVGFWTKSDAVSYFSDASVEFIPRIPAAQMLVNSVMEKLPRILALQIYATDTNGVTRVIASDNAKEIGQTGTDAEAQAISDGKTFFGRDRAGVILTMPLRDRNGDYIAAMRVKLKTFFGETQDNAVTRAMMVRKKMEEIGTSGEDLLK
jgi:hypothetical protein